MGRSANQSETKTFAPSAKPAAQNCSGCATSTSKTTETASIEVTSTSAGIAQPLQNNALLVSGVHAAWGPPRKRQKGRQACRRGAAKHLDARIATRKAPVQASGSRLVGTAEIFCTQRPGKSYPDG